MIFCTSSGFNSEPSGLGATEGVGVVETLTVEGATVATDVDDEVVAPTAVVRVVTAVGKALVGVVATTVGLVIDELFVFGVSLEQLVSTKAKPIPPATIRIGVLFTTQLRG